jgi:hypothetical protein
VFSTAVIGEFRRGAIGIPTYRRTQAPLYWASNVAGESVDENNHQREDVMRQLRKFGSALALAAMIAGGMMLGTARVEAKGGKGGGGGSVQAAVCTYLLSVITYPYISPEIQAYAVSLYVAMAATRRCCHSRTTSDVRWFRRAIGQPPELSPPRRRKFPPYKPKNTR